MKAELSSSYDLDVTMLYGGKALGASTTLRMNTRTVNDYYDGTIDSWSMVLPADLYTSLVNEIY